MTAYHWVIFTAALACNAKTEQQQLSSGSRVPAESSQSTTVELKVDAKSYKVPATVQLRLVNKSIDTVGFNLCPTKLERQVAATWTPVAEDRMCTMELRLLPPQDSATAERPLAATIDPGSYRFVGMVNVGGQPRELVSATFKVEK